MSKIVIIQPMLLPWIGFFEQLKIADYFVFYDDVQLSRGKNFVCRVQVKTSNGLNWLTVPIDHARSGKTILETMMISDKKWRFKHLETLRHSYSRAKNFKLMFELAREIYSFNGDNLSEFNCNSIKLIANWLGISSNYLHSSELNINGSSSQRLVDICSYLNAKYYITGLGALNYLDYSLFEGKNINVCYMYYKKKEYSQIHGLFTPFVSIFDAIANCGTETINFICSESIYWKDFLNEQQ